MPKGESYLPPLICCVTSFTVPYIDCKYTSPTTCHGKWSGVGSWLVCSTLDRAPLFKALARAIVFLGKTLYFHSASLHPGV